MNTAQLQVQSKLNLPESNLAVMPVNAADIIDGVSEKVSDLLNFESRLKALEDQIKNVRAINIQWSKRQTISSGWKATFTGYGFTTKVTHYSWIKVNDIEVASYGYGDGYPSHAFLFNKGDTITFDRSGTVSVVPLFAQ